MRDAHREHPAPLAECYDSHCHVEANEHVTSHRLRRALSLEVRNQQDHDDVCQCENEAAKPRDGVKLLTDIGAVFELTAPSEPEICTILAAPVVVEWARVPDRLLRFLAPLLGHDAPPLHRLTTRIL